MPLFLAVIGISVVVETKAKQRAGAGSSSRPLEAEARRLPDKRAQAKGEYL